MASSIIRRTLFGWAAPAGGLDLSTPTVMTTTAAASSVVITFNEAMRTAPAFGQFTATVNAVARGVNAASVAGSALTLTLASAVSAGNAVVVSYVPGGTPSTRLADARGNEVLSASPLASATAT